ncbi:hypothetical protein KP803_07045 [Vibrio sp. ZSDE26]|uniref:Beta-mannosidase-like galactose-binding domain-containing protein n=1 Tax=Vibrio amylolyticus TaxID=2847292 RepID=A0A9X1XLF5_9VIBR|nr:hypothetical protein [Vibrio amylolyticus]MCK6263035.1 hypothetical protein [Vibrio amylolyticus]
MQISLAGLWQLSPLTDLSIPQDDITFPAPLSAVLPNTLSEEAIAEQEWHLMHDVEVDETMLANSAIDLVISGIGHHAEIRVNGEAVFDCDEFRESYRKDILPYLQLGRNRFEILFLEQDEDWLLEEEQNELSHLSELLDKEDETRIGIWQTPYLEVLPTARIEQVDAELVNHQVGGCEVLVHLKYQAFKPGLLSAQIKFNGMTYRLPLDVRASKTSAVFQLDAPMFIDPEYFVRSDCYLLDVQLENSHRAYQVGLFDRYDQGNSAQQYMKELHLYPQN